MFAAGPANPQTFALSGHQLLVPANHPSTCSAEVAADETARETVA